MASDVVPGFTSIDLAIRNYVHVEIDERSLSMSPPKAIDLKLGFVRFLVDRGMSELNAYELWTRHDRNVLFAAGAAAATWNDLGEDRPYAPLIENDGMFACWRNPRFAELTGYNPVPESFASAYDWIRRNAGTAFLLPALCYLRAIGCDRIFLTDSTGDEGIDCIGRIGSGPMRSMAVFVQAKSSLDFVTGDQFSAMHSRYAGLPSTKMFGLYLEALDIPRSQTGGPRVFVVAAQGRFKAGASQLAWKTGVLIRSGRAIAQALGDYYPKGALEELTDRISLPEGLDLVRNLAGDLARR